MTEAIVIVEVAGQPAAFTLAEIQAAQERAQGLLPVPAQPSAPVELLDADACAARLGVTARWLEDAARLGIVPHHRMGRFVRFDAREVAAHCRVSGAPIPGTDGAATDNRSDARGNGLMRQALAGRVSRMSPELSRRDTSREGPR